MCTPLKILNRTSKADKLLKAKGEIFKLQRTLDRTRRNNEKTNNALAWKYNETIKTFAHAFNKMRAAKIESDKTAAELRSDIARMLFNTEIMCRNSDRETHELRNRIAKLEAAAQEKILDIRVPPVVLPPVVPPGILQRESYKVSTLLLSSRTAII